jgi:hypothetical protein
MILVQFSNLKFLRGLAANDGNFKLAAVGDSNVMIYQRLTNLPKINPADRTP